jgi:hypothetical protein
VAEQSSESLRWQVVVHGKHLPAAEDLAGCFTARQGGIVKVLDLHGYPPPEKTFYTLETSRDVDPEQIREAAASCLQSLGATVDLLVVRPQAL